jgi:CHAT domain-containing protein
MKGGILTAYEAMNLNFDNTELVVLSACETGRGEVQAGEGVYGLQRAFLIAGADAVIMSLFKVNDEVTQKLMMHFYVNWLKTGDKRKSFIEAKKAIKSEYDSPIYWGAFIMIEGNPQANVPHSVIK